MEEREARERAERIETLLEEVESMPDPAARDTAMELVQALLDLYGEGLTRLVARLPDPEALTDDELVSHLLLLHGIHPVPLEPRVRGALEEVRPYLESHGGGVELLGIAEGVVRLRLEGSCSGCPSSTMTLKLAIEDAIHKAAPDVERIEAEGAAEEPPTPALIQLAPLEPAAANGAGRPNGAWTSAGDLAGLAGGGTLLKEVAGEPVLFLELDGNFYAYRPGCPGCGQSLEGAALRGSELACSGCGDRFDVSRAGRCADEAGLHLEPLPLLEDDGGSVRIALAPSA